MKSNAKPGAMLRRLRVEKGWKLADLASRTGLPISTLSKLENDKISLSYDKLARISKALEVDTGVFFAPSAVTVGPRAGTGRRSIMRAGEGQEINTEVYNHLYQATDLLNKRFIPIIAYPHARSIEEFGDWVRHPGDEYTYVIEGTVDFYSELYAPVRLEQGDSIYFDSSMGHAYIAVGDAPCRGLTICAGDESQGLATPEKPAEPSRNAASAVVERPPFADGPKVQRKAGARKAVAAAAKGVRKVRNGG